MEHTFPKIVSVVHVYSNFSLLTVHDPLLDHFGSVGWISRARCATVHWPTRDTYQGFKISEDSQVAYIRRLVICIAMSRYYSCGPLCNNECFKSDRCTLKYTKGARVTERYRSRAKAPDFCLGGRLPDSTSINLRTQECVKYFPKLFWVLYEVMIRCEQIIFGCRI